MVRTSSRIVIAALVVVAIALDVTVMVQRPPTQSLAAAAPKVTTVISLKQSGNGVVVSLLASGSLSIRPSGDVVVSNYPSQTELCVVPATFTRSFRCGIPSFEMRSNKLELVAAYYGDRHYNASATMETVTPIYHVTLMARFEPKVPLQVVSSEQ